MKIMVAFLGKKNKKQKKRILNDNMYNLRLKENYYKNNINNKFKNKFDKKSLKNKTLENSIISNIIGKNNESKLKEKTKSIVKNSIFANTYNKRKLVSNSQFRSEELLQGITNTKSSEKIGINKLIYSMFLTVPLFLFALMNINKIDTALIYFATNFRQADEKNIQIADLIATYGLYNSNNYIIKNKEVVQNIEKAEEVIINTDEEILDKEVEIEDMQTLLGNEKVNVQVTENSKNIQRITVGTTKILNYSSKRDIDFEGLLNTNVTLTKKSDKILLYNTHTSESYTNSENYKFEYTGTMRTTDAEYNMLAIAKKFDENLKSKGFESVQNTTPHDYGTYTSAYAKSRITVTDALAKMQGAGIIIDVHRDAVADLTFRPSVNIKGVNVAQLMFVVGVGSDSIKNDNWQDNLKLALKLQQIADKLYPGLFRPMIIRNSVYNQDLNKYSLLIEFGATGNTIEEVKLSTRCITNLLNIIYKD